MRVRTALPSAVHGCSWKQTSIGRNTHLPSILLSYDEDDDEPHGVDHDGDDSEDE